MRQDTHYIRNCYVLSGMKWFMLLFCIIFLGKKEKINIREVTDSYFLAASMMLFLKNHCNTLPVRCCVYKV